MPSNTADFRLGHREKKRIQPLDSGLHLTSKSSDHDLKRVSKDVFDGLVVGCAVELLDRAGENESVQREKLEGIVAVAARFAGHVPVEKKVLQRDDGRSCSWRSVVQWRVVLCTDRVTSKW